MCEPTTLFMAAGAGLSAVSNYGQNQAKAAAAEQQAAQYRLQADVQNRQAMIEQQTAQFQERQKTNKLDQLQGKQINTAAASGFAIDGSPADAITDSKQQGMLDVAAIQYGANLKDSNLGFDAQVNQVNAQGEDAAAGYYRQASVTSALQPLIGLGSNDRFMTRLGNAF